VKGVGLNFVGGDVLVLIVYCTVVVWIAARSFKRRLD
jgi:hypothetical protein